MLKEVVPRVSRVAVFRNPANAAAHTLALKELEVAARSLRVQLQVLQAREPDEFESTFAAIARERVGALLVLGDLIKRI